jgi:4-diphosphocytidyl-2-C-methyl-D-erythritol kinase
VSASDGNTAAQWVPTGSVTVRVPGKVNLYLAVGDRRKDGYHELTTVFQAVSLLDEVTVRNADVLSLELVGEGADTLPTDEGNLAWQAAELMADHVGRAPDVSIMIDKSIPVAGGMAGGSADAAAVLVAMNSLWELNVPRRDLRMLAAQLGSDVPFALHGGTALGTGRGEELATVLSRNTFHWVLAFADSELLTPAVFTELDRLRDAGDPPRLAGPGPVLAALAAGDPEELGPLLGNELQAAAVSLEPALRRALRAGVGAGALAGIVSGSGPTCAFLCASAASAVDVGTELSGAGVCRTVRVASGPVPGARIVPAPTEV